MSFSHSEVVKSEISEVCELVPQVDSLLHNGTPPAVERLTGSGLVDVNAVTERVFGMIDDMLLDETEAKLNRELSMLETDYPVKFDSYRKLVSPRGFIKEYDHAKHYVDEMRSVQSVLYEDSRESVKASIRQDFSILLSDSLIDEHEFLDVFGKEYEKACRQFNLGVATEKTAIDSALAKERKVSDFVCANLYDYFAPICRARLGVGLEEFITSSAERGAVKLAADVRTQFMKIAGVEVDLASIGVAEDKPAHSELDQAEIVTSDDAVIANIESPFPWTGNDMIDIELLSDSLGNQMIYVEAFSPAMRTIRERIRFGGSAHSKKIESQLALVKRIELSSNGSGYGSVKSLSYVDFYGLTICAYKDIKPNASRIYYAVTQLGSCDYLKQEPSVASLNRSTKVMLMLAETDKAHQRKVFREFGCKPSSLRGSRVGSI